MLTTLTVSMTLPARLREKAIMDGPTGRLGELGERGWQKTMAAPRHVERPARVERRSGDRALEEEEEEGVEEKATVPVAVSVMVALIGCDSVSSGSLRRKKC